jgi:hypothetical protein
MNAKTPIQTFSNKPTSRREVGQKRKIASETNFHFPDHERIIPGWAREEFANVSKDFERQMSWILGGPNVKK